jgi:hypothetical protein
MRRRATWFTSASIAFVTAASAAAGTLDFWEHSRGAQDTTASFPTGTAWTAQIRFDADSAEGGGMVYGASEITIRPTGSVDFKDWSCALTGCNNSDYNFRTGTAGQPPGPEDGVLVVSDPDLDEKHGIYDLGTITFDGPQEPGTMLLVTCNYTTLDFVERTCNPFVLVTLPEPGGAAALLAGAALLYGPLRRRHHIR